MAHEGSVAEWCKEAYLIQRHTRTCTSCIKEKLACTERSYTSKKGENVRLQKVNVIPIPTNGSIAYLASIFFKKGYVPHIKKAHSFGCTLKLHQLTVKVSVRAYKCTYICIRMKFFLGYLLLSLSAVPCKSFKHDLENSSTQRKLYKKVEKNWVSIQKYIPSISMWLSELEVLF